MNWARSGTGGTDILMECDKRDDSAHGPGVPAPEGFQRVRF